MTLSPLNYVKPGGEAPAASADAVSATKVFSGSSKDVDREVAAWKHKAWTEGVEVSSGDGSNTILFKDVKYGDCGYSSVELKDYDGFVYDEVAYFELEIWVDKPATDFYVQSQIFNEPGTAPYSFPMIDAGELFGGDSWSQDGLLKLPEEGYYGATMDSGVVNLVDGSQCIALGPRVDDVHVN